jgi:outer membrane protein OmpA-like peptidoglycan-associated protein
VPFAGNKNNTMKNTIFSLMCLMVLLVACKAAQKSQQPKNDQTGLNKSEKGAVIGASSGAVVGGIIGNNNKNTALGAILGAAVGGTIGAVIGNKMDKQAKKMEEDLGTAATVERVGEGIKLTFNSQLLFDTGKKDLKEANKTDLQKFAETLKQYPETEVLIVGHTDNVGTEASNQTLSEQRSGAVSSYLGNLGVNSSRLRVQGYGETQPTTSNDTESNRSQNRRVEIAIYANEKMKSDAKTEVGQ